MEQSLLVNAPGLAHGQHRHSFHPRRGGAHRRAHCAVAAAGRRAVIGNPALRQAGVVFAAAAAEILPQVKHEGAIIPTAIGGMLGVATMLAIKKLEESWKGPAGMLSAIGIDLFVDGVVLGLAFLAGEKAGFLLAFALTLEVLFLGLTLTTELSEVVSSRIKVLAVTVGLALLLPLGSFLATPVGHLPPDWIIGFLAFGLMALLYLVTEELLVEAHEKPDTPLISAMFFVGFLGLLLIEEAL